MDARRTGAASGQRPCTPPPFRALLAAVATAETHAETARKREERGDRNGTTGVCEPSPCSFRLFHPGVGQIAAVGTKFTTSSEV